MSCLLALSPPLSQAERLARGGRLQRADGLSSLYDLQALVKAGDASRLSPYVELRHEWLSAGKVQQQMPFVVDTSQNMERRRVGTTTFPTLTCSGSYYSFHRQRWMMGQELLCVQGIPMEGQRRRFGNPWYAAAAQLSSSELRIIAGNCQNVCCVAALQLWLLSNLTWTA